MKKFLIFLTILGIIGLGVGAGFAYVSHDKPATKEVLPAQQVATLPTKELASPTEIANAIPKTLRIPSINLEATIESVGMDAKGNMDTPKDSDNVAWYNLGYKPGTVGNAVIAGHYDKADGSPAVFWNLSKLAVGDKVMVTDENGSEQTFQVVRSEKYPYDQFPLQEVFGKSDKKMLNFITCQGEWNSEAKNYSHRSVIYTELVE